MLELTADRAKQARLVPVIHLGRIVILIGLLVGLHRLSDQRLQRTGYSAPVTIDLDTVAGVHPDVASIEPVDNQRGAFRLLDSEGKSLAIVTQTSPDCDAIVGYAGPSNLLVVMDEEWVVQSVRLLRCPDTAEHLRMVENDQRFWQQFVGWKWGETATLQVDGVSGSTLTSLAIAESVAWRLSRPIGAAAEPPPLVRSSLRFSAPISAESVNRWFETAVSVREVPGSPFLLECLDEYGAVVGVVARTGPLDDTVVGYRGPTEVWLQVTTASGAVLAAASLEMPIVVDAMLGETFDNQPYLNYVKQERSFWKKFRNRSLESLATIDFEAELIDGVSGATMTSMAVAETIRNASQKWIELIEIKARAASQEAQPPAAVAGPLRERSLNTSWREWLTGGSVLAALFWSRSRLRGRRRLRLLWQIAMLVAIGWISGNLLSLALLGGWTRGGMAWHFAPGLTLLATAALLAPALLKGNVYCDHICPHGILQQWIRPTRPRKINRLIRAILRGTAVGFVVLTLIMVIQPTTINFAWFEPFDLYASGAVLSVTAIIWAISLVLARITPMGYCRLACPTGLLLDYARRDASRHRLTITDALLLCAVISVWGYVWIIG